MSYRYDLKIKKLKQKLQKARFSKDPQDELSDETIIEIEQQIEDLEIASELANERLNELKGGKG